MGSEYLDEIQFNSKELVKKKKSKAILDELNDLDDVDDFVPLPKSIFTKEQKEEKHSKDKKKKKKAKEVVDEEYLMSTDLDDDWATTLSSFKVPKTKKKSKNIFSHVNLKDDKKKKKKDKKGGGVNHKKDFEPEMILLRNLQIDQNKFVDSLQKKYNQLENTKSTARGVGKYTTDLINSITSARSLSMQLVDRIISTKKTIADLDFKERKEFGSDNNSEQQNLTNYASTYLKQMMTVGRNNVVGQQEAYDNFDTMDDSDTDDLFDSISESLGETDRDESVEKYLQYENDNVQVEVIWNDDAPDDNLDLKYDYIAINQSGDIVEDYPLPEKTKLNINRSTQTATDIYGNKYRLNIR